jgi:hypothetical protein
MTLPATVANLDLVVVGEVLVRHACNVTDASRDLGVPPSDLRRLLWTIPKLQEVALEVVEARLDKAERNIHEALDSEDSRRRDAASFFVVRNTGAARRRGWITSASSVDLSVSVPSAARTMTFRWKTDEDERREAAEAERERGKLIEHQPEG